MPSATFSRRRFVCLLLLSPSRCFHLLVVVERGSRSGGRLAQAIKTSAFRVSQTLCVSQLSRRCSLVGLRSCLASCSGKEVDNCPAAFATSSCVGEQPGRASSRLRSHTQRHTTWIAASPCHATRLEGRALGFEARGQAPDGLRCDSLVPGAIHRVTCPKTRI